MLGFAFLLPVLTWPEAAAAAILVLLFNIFLLPQLAPELIERSQPPQASRENEHQSRASLISISSASTGMVSYPLAVLLLILFYRREMYVVGAVWAMMAVGDVCAGIAGEAAPGPALPYNGRKTWPGFVAFVLAGTAGAYVLARWLAPVPDPSRPLPFLMPTPGKLLMICAATALVGALVESIPVGLDEDLTVSLVAGGFMYCISLIDSAALAGNLPYLKRRVVFALIVNLAFALVAFWLKAVDRSGAAVGLVLGIAIYMGFGWKSFALLVAFFSLGSFATRLGYAHKHARGTAERRGGARSWREAVANSLASAFFALLAIATRHEGAFLVALTASLAEAAGDTVSSEIGQWISPRAYLVTTLEPVRSGEHGGVSLVGSAAGLTALALVVLLGYLLGVTSPGGVLIAFAGAVTGNLLDSVLGATLERAGLVTNGIVNFAGTSLAGGVALAVALHRGM